MTAIELMALVDKDREARGMSRAGYAAYLGIHKSNYTRLLSGERQPSNKFLDKLAHRVPALWPDIEAYIKGIATELAASISSDMTLRAARKAIDKGGAV